MAGKLGEVFVEILGDSSPFADDFADALGNAGDLATDELTGAMEEATDEAGGVLLAGMEEAGGELVTTLGAAGTEAGAGLVTPLGEAGEQAAGDLVTTLGDAGTEAAGDLADGVGSALDGVVLDPGGLFDPLTEEAAAAASDTADALEGGLADLDIDVDAGGSFDGIAEAAESAATDAGDAFAGVGDTIADEIAAGVDSAEESMGGLVDSLGSVQGALGTVAGGAGLEAFARGAGDSTAALGRMSGRLGESEDDLRSMIDGVTNWTFSSNDAAAGMELLSQRGIDNMDTMEQLLPVWDDFADATGGDYVASMEEGSRVLGAFGIPAEEAGDHIDTLTYLVNESGVPMDRLARTMRNSGEDAEAMGLGIDETSGLISAMVANGMDGKDAVALFGKELGNAEGDLDVLLSSLGLTAAEFDEYTGKVGEAAGLTAEQAGIANDTATPMQRLGGYMENLSFRFGAFGETAGMLAAPLGALGPMMLGLNQGSQLLAGGMGGKLVGGLKAAAGGFKTLAMAILTNPIFLIAAVVIAIVAAIWYFRDEIIGALGAAWDWIKDVFGGIVGWFSDVWASVVETVPEAFRSLMEWLSGLGERIVEAVSGMASTVRDWFVEHNPIAYLRDLSTEAWDTVSAWFSELAGRIVETLGGLATTVFDFIREYHPIAILWRLVAEYAPQVLAAIVDFIGDIVDTIAGWVEDVVGFVTDLWKRWVALVHTIRDAVIDAIVGLVSSVVDTVSGWVETIVGFVTNLWDRWQALTYKIKRAVIDAVVGMVRSVVGTVSGWVSDVLGFVGNLRTRFTSGISGMIDNVLGFFRAMPGRVLRSLGNLGSTLVNAGKDLIRGLWNGVKGMGTWLKDKLLGFVADKIPGPIARALGIASPSTVFAGFGRNLIEGLTVGVEDEADSALRVVEDFANSVASAGEMGAIFNEEEFQPVGQQQPTTMRPVEADPVGVGATAARSEDSGPQVVQNIYTVDPVKAGRQSVRELRELTYLSAPFAVPKVGDNISERRDPHRGG